MDRSFNPPPWKLDGDVIREGAEKLKARMEAKDAKYMASAHPKRTIVRRVVGEWEDA